jgi:NDP-sugar pyrophosphorylase family protein
MQSNPESPYILNDVVILAGGVGTRLGKVSKGLPKPMVPVLRKPFMEWIILYLKSFGFATFTISTGYRRELVKEYFGGGERLGIALQYCEEDHPHGTGGALKKACGMARSSSVLVMNGDTLCMCDMRDFYRLHKQLCAPATICCVGVEDTHRYGTVQAGLDNRVMSFVEKGQSSGKGFINAGAYWMTRSFIEGIPDSIPLSLEKDVFQTAVGRDIYAYCSNADFIDMGTPEALEAAPEFLTRNGFLKFC